MKSIDPKYRPPGKLPPPTLTPPHPTDPPFDPSVCFLDGVVDEEYMRPGWEPPDSITPAKKDDPPTTAEDLKKLYGLRGPNLEKI